MLSKKGKFPKKDLRFKRFGKWLVLDWLGKSKHHQNYWLCCCDCGTVRPVSKPGVRSNSCGCAPPKPRTNCKHNKKHPLYEMWKGMRTRCNNPNHTRAKNYSERGISLCSEWNDFWVFVDWANKNGWKQGLTIERKDVNGNYCPENCTWIKNELQAQNRTTNQLTAKQVSFIKAEYIRNPDISWAKLNDQLGIKGSRNNIRHAAIGYTWKNIQPDFNLTLSDVIS